MVISQAHVSKILVVLETILQGTPISVPKGRPVVEPKRQKCPWVGLPLVYLGTVSLPYLAAPFVVLRACRAKYFVVLTA